MGNAQNPTWYVLDPTGRANMHHTEEDAWETAHGFDAMWPAYGPYRPVRIYTEDDFNKEVKARITAQNELAQLRNQLAQAFVKSMTKE